MIFRKKTPEDRITYGNHPGDYGIVLIAALITFGFIYLLLTPQNFGALFAGAPTNAAQPPPASRPGETPMQIYEKKR